MSSIEQTDAQSAAVQKTPNRISLAHIKEQIASETYFTLGEAMSALDLPVSGPTLNVFTICALTMKNGFIVMGKSAPADPANFNADLGKQFAYEECVRQLWPLEAYQLRTTLSAAEAK